MLKTKQEKEAYEYRMLMLSSKEGGLAVIKQTATDFLNGTIDAMTFRHLVHNELVDDSGMDMDDSEDTIKLAQMLAR